jgi:hypothetical protein
MFENTTSEAAKIVSHASTSVGSQTAFGINHFLSLVSEMHLNKFRR